MWIGKEFLTFLFTVLRGAWWKFGELTHDLRKDVYNMEKGQHWICQMFLQYQKSYTGGCIYTFKMSLQIFNCFFYYLILLFYISTFGKKGNCN